MMVDFRVRAYGLLKEAVQDLGKYTDTLESTALFAAEHPCTQIHTHTDVCWIEQIISQHMKGIRVAVESMSVSIALPVGYPRANYRPCVTLPINVISYCMMDEATRAQWYRIGATGKYRDKRAKG